MFKKVSKGENLKIKIKFLGPLSRPDLDVDVANTQALKEILKQNIAEEWLLSVAIAVNGDIVKDLNNIKDGDVLSILPPVCGG